MQARNRNYGKLVNGAIVYAPKNLLIGGVLYADPTAEQYLAAGWKRIDDTRPEPSDGYVWVANGWVDDEDAIKRVWKLEPTPVSVEDYDAAMEAHITQERVARGYTTREPSAYVNSPNPRFAQDAADWAQFLADVMDYGLAVLNEYQRTGVAPMSFAEFKAGLPRIKWTEA